MSSVKLPLEIQKVSWANTTTNKWGTQLTHGVSLLAGNTYLLIAKFPKLSPSTIEGYPVYMGFSTATTNKPIISYGTAVWIVTPSSDKINTCLYTGYSAAATYTDTDKAGLWAIKIS